LSRRLSDKSTEEVGLEELPEEDADATVGTGMGSAAKEAPPPASSGEYAVVADDAGLDTGRKKDDVEKGC
jgi:hypothetical protein